MTRYLCASAHLDHGRLALSGWRFRRKVLEEVGRHPYKAIGASPGVELAPVVAHCRAATARKRVRDAALAALLVALALAVLAADPGGERVLIAVCIAVIAWEVVYTEMAIAVHRVVAPMLLRGSAQPGPEVHPGQEPRLDELIAAETGNITVYSGFSPFVGSGLELGGWSFALDAARGKTELGRTLTPRPFTLEALYSHVSEAVEGLRAVGVAVDDQIHVDGREIRHDPRFLGSPLQRPRVHADPGLLGSVMAGSDEHIRFYKRIRAFAWRGALVLTVFLRFSGVGDKLFTEVNYLLLPPLDRRYRHADKVQRVPAWRDRIRLAGEALAATPLLWLLAPIALVDAAAAPLNRWSARRRRRREVLDNPAFDYGAGPTLRETASSKNFDQYFQKLDSEMYQKVIERQILDAIIEFLDAHDVDTSDLKERETAILNNGVIVTGGSVRAESLAVGRRAQATTRRTARGGSG